MPKDERFGKRYMHVEATGAIAPIRALTFTTITYDIVPVRPKGWMIRRLGPTSTQWEWVFGGVVIPWNTAMEWTRHMIKKVKMQNTVIGEDVSAWQDLDFLIQEIDKPVGAVTLLIDEMDARIDASRTTAVRPAAPKKKEIKALPPAKLENEPPMGLRTFLTTKNGDENAG